MPTLLYTSLLSRSQLTSNTGTVTVLQSYSMYLIASGQHNRNPNVCYYATVWGKGSSWRRLMASFLLLNSLQRRNPAICRCSILTLSTRIMKIISVKNTGRRLYFHRLRSSTVTNRTPRLSRCRLSQQACWDSRDTA